MKKIIFLLILIRINLTVLSFDIGGSITETFYNTEKSGSFKSSYNTELGLDFKYETGDDVFYFDGVSSYFSGNTYYDYTQVMPVNVLSFVNVFNSYLYESESEDSAYFNTCYYKKKLAKTDLYIGRISIASGLAYYFNPTDIFNAKDIFSPGPAAYGNMGIRIDHNFDYNKSFVFYRQNDDDSGDGWYTRYTQNFQKTELSLSFAKKNGYFMDVINDIYSDDIKKVWGLNLFTSIKDKGIYVEYALKKSEINPDYSEYVIGTDYTLENGFYYLLEYHYNGSGTKTEYDLNDYTNYYYGEKSSMVKDEIVLYASYPYKDNVELSLMTCTGISDRSAVISPTYSLTIDDFSSYYISMIIYTGGNGTQFSAKNSNYLEASYSRYF